MNSDQAQTRLLALKAELEARLQRTHKHIHGREAPVSQDFSEQASETGNDAVVYGLDAEGREELQQVNRALQRLAAGSYFSCRSCGGSISAQRLQALPWTDLCIGCAT